MLTQNLFTLSSRSFLDTVRRHYEKLFISQSHPFHLVEVSILPFSVALSLFFVVVFLIDFINSFLPCTYMNVLSFDLVGLFMMILMWFIMIVIEAVQGYHTRVVQKGLKKGMLLFMVSEIMFFFAFFWAYFHYTLNPSVTVGSLWPAFALQILNPWGLPFMNTILLLSSGVTITLAHGYLLKSKDQHFALNLASTVILGATFLVCQLFEYKFVVNFYWVGDVYGSVFFATTGFHGLHVTVGTLFLFFCLTRYFIMLFFGWIFVPNNYNVPLPPLYRKHPYNWYMPRHLQVGFTATEHLGFEAAAWYWHFVDVVWLALFVLVYWSQ